jgi:hypothetical protein
MKIGRSPEGLWLLLDGEFIVESFTTKEEAIKALQATSPPKEKVHKHSALKFSFEWKDLGVPDRHGIAHYQRIALGYKCETCWEYVEERIIGHALLYRDGKWYNELGEDAEPIPERYW